MASEQQHLAARSRRLVPAKWLVGASFGLAVVFSAILYVVPGTLQEPTISVISILILVFLTTSFVGGVWLFAMFRESIWLKLAFMSIIVAFVFFSFLVVFGMSRLH